MDICAKYPNINVNFAAILNYKVNYKIEIKTEVICVITNM